MLASLTMSTSRWTAADLPDLTGRTAIVTGATSGIGRVTATELATHGARVILAVRNREAGAALANELPGRASVLPLELSSLESVQQAAAAVDEPIDLLVNNAGVMYPPRLRITGDGHELQFQTNHLGHFALTALLLPRLLDAPSPRVVTVASIAHLRADRGVLHANLPADGERYWPQRTYANSKLANLLFALELHRRATATGSPLASVAAHPGVTSTNLFASKDGLGAIPLLGLLSRPVMGLLMPAPDQGAEATLYAAAVAAPGSYTGPTQLFESRGPVGPARLSDLAQDTELAAELWTLSEELTGIPFPLGERA